ncbi:DUF4190 domain-containing protein [Protaetiibacter mangrovi]|uniref:DUF4190 domain-containing protein n=1 Tax=Protaetiibacter mangrovi TaxID=2970926 RepID=A0ABT1ZEV8_9MICO|nr:DUF4190 domain-containing protein [Protaetiibacter mangrovi]MCS0499237.1 DUF4190 domain-containing protein [Protaetiibacter mangrovi]TPX00763.1 DUF4190 domain-containing protein [Schumannella luteola]
MTDTTSTPAVDEPTAAAEQPPAATPENPYAAPRAASPTTATNAFSIASLVLGIAAIPTGWWIASVVAIVFGFIARSREPQARTMSTWGIVLGFVGAFGWLVLAILGLALAAPFALWGAAIGWGPDFLGF